jgi:Flp pilus assembly CpaF family ATPase
MFLIAGDTGRGATNIVNAMAMTATQIRWLHGVFIMVLHHLSQALP